jgi:precorrin-6x reductase
MTNILLRLFDLDIKNKQIIMEKDRFVQNLQGALEKEEKLKTLQDKNSENNQVLAKLQAARQKINNMEKQSKDSDNIIIGRDSL